MRKLIKIFLILGGIDIGIKGLGIIFNKNWQIIGLFKDFSPIVPTIFYILIGISAVYSIFKKDVS